MSNEKKSKKIEQDNSNKVLLHTCCAPCSIHCVDSLRAEGLEPVSYWFNPNIHPYTEYRSRKTALEAYAKEKGMTLTQGPSPEIIKEIADTLIMRILTSKIEDIPKALVRPINMIS